MPRRVKGPDGKIHAFPDDVTDDEIRSAFGGDTSTAAPKPQVASGNTFGEKILNAAKMLGSAHLGALKGAAHTALDLGEMAGGLSNPFNPAGGTLREAVDTLYGKPGLSNAAMGAAREDTAYGNTAERVGGALETAAEMAIPVGEGAAAVKAAVPSAARAGKLFEGVKAAAKAVPIDVSAPGDVALRIADLAQRGGGTNFGPAPVRQFIQWVTDPNKGPMTYDVAKDFASNISRLSAKDTMSIPPAMQREIHQLRVVLNKAVGDAAAKVGKGEDYARAMNEYAKAMRLRDAVDAAKEGAAKYLPKAAGALGLGAAGAIGYKAYKALGGD